MYAWRARDVLGLPQETRRPDRRPHQPLRARARSSASRACASTRSTGTASCTRTPRRSRATPSCSCNDYRAQVARFATGITQPADPAAARPTSARATASTTSRTAADAPVQPRQRRVRERDVSTSSSTTSRRCARGWRRCAPRARRRCSAPGSSTSSTATGPTAATSTGTPGYGFKRWHAGRTWALAQQGLLAIAVCAALPATTRRIGRGPSTCSTAGWRCTSGCREQAADAQGHRSVEPLRRRRGPLGPSIRELFAARMQANAARAVALGLGGDAGRGAAAAVLVRPRHRAAGDHDAHLQHRGRSP